MIHQERKSLDTLRQEDPNRYLAQKARTSLIIFIPLCLILVGVPITLGSVLAYHANPLMAAGLGAVVGGLVSLLLTLRVVRGTRKQLVKEMQQRQAQARQVRTVRGR